VTRVVTCAMIFRSLAMISRRGRY